MYGYAGKLLQIDLKSEQIEEEKLDEKLAEKFIGGKGLGAKILYDLGENTNPFDPSNLLILGTGPLTGTRAPTSGRWVVITKSPLTGLFLDSHCGGFFGMEMKKAGYDFIILRGRAEEPVYLFINDDDVKIEDAGHLWGKGSFEVEEFLYQKYGGKTISIGPAGERLVRYALINTGSHGHHGRAGHAGRGGAGAVMGSKNLKAVVIKGSRKIKYANPEKFDEAVKKANKVIKENSFVPIRRKYGTPVWINPVNEAGLLPTKNFSEGIFEKAGEISGERMQKEIVVKNRACFGCSIACGKLSEVNFGKKVEIEGPEYETIAMLGSNCGNDSLDAIGYLNYLCDDYGLDTISTGNVIGYAIECSKKGLIKEKLDFGDPGGHAELIKKIAFRKGIGDLLAEGVKISSEKIGGKEYAMQINGMEFPGYDPRGAWGMALAYATSDRGACHQRAWTVNAEMKGELKPRFSMEGRAKWVKEAQDERAACYSLVLCDFAPLKVENFVELLNAATGFNYSKEEYLIAGERIWNMTRLFNIREGIKRDNRLPQRLHQPLPDNEEKVIKKKEFEEALDEYYELRGWDKNGRPTKEKLKELEI